MRMRIGELSTAGEQGGVAYAAHVGGAGAEVFFGLVSGSDHRMGPDRPRQPIVESEIED